MKKEILDPTKKKKPSQTLPQLFRQRSRVGAVVRALAFHQCDPGSIAARSHMLVEFGSRLSPRRFLWVLQFSSLHKKPPSLNSNSIRMGDRKPDKTDVASFLILHFM